MKALSRPTFLLVFLAFCTPSIAQETQTPKSLLWRISGNGLSKTSYLFGTMHLQDKRLFYFTDSLYSYLGSAEGFAMEIHPDSILRASIAYVDKLQNQKLVRDNLSAPDFEKFKTKLKKDLNLEADKLTVRDAYLLREKLTKPPPKSDDMQTVVDLYLYGIAQDQGKILTGLEKVEDQLALIDDFTNDFDVKKLMKDIDKEKDFTENMVQMYQKEDLEDIQKITSFLPEEMEDKLLNRRNELMAHKMDSLMHEHSYFIAVGAAHLPGTAGIIELLRKKGYQVAPVYSNKRVDPSTFVRKTIDKWQEYTEASQGYSIRMPGKPSPLTMNEGEVKLNMYLDMLTNKVYFVGFIRPGILITAANADSLLKGMAEASARENLGKVISIKTISSQGFQGLEAIIHNVQRDMYMKVQYLAKARRVYMVAVGAQHQADIETPLVQDYLSSFKIFDPTKASWAQYKFDHDHFSIQFPGIPETNRFRESDSTITAFKYTASDDNNGIAYMTMVTSVRPGFYFQDDSTLFRTYMKTLMSKGTVYQQKRYSFEGFPAVNFIGDMGNRVLVKGRLINRGNRNYKILVFYEVESARDSSIDRYLNSFSFLPLNTPTWSLHNIPELGIQTYAPGPFVKDAEQTISISNYSNDEEIAWHCNDSIYLSSPTISYQLISPYSWAKNDSSFLKMRMHRQVTHDEEIDEYHFQNSGKLTWIEFILRKTNSESRTKGRIYLNGEKIITQQYILPEPYLNETPAKQFFDGVRFDKEETSNVTRNTPDKLFNDLHSSDSARYNKAYNFLSAGRLSLDPGDEEMILNQALSEFPKDTANYQTVNDLLFKEANENAKESHVELIKSDYERLSASQEKYRYDLLEILARIKSTKSYEAIDALLNLQPPTQGYSSVFERRLLDSLELTVKMLPTLLKHAADTLLGPQLFGVYENLLKQDLISIDALRPHEADMHKVLKFVIQKLKHLPDDDYYAFPRSEAFKILARFHDQKSFEILHEFSRVRESFVSMDAITTLLENQQTPAATAIEKLAGDKSFRSNLYTQLEKAKKQSLFPAKYLNRSSFAEAYLNETLEDEEPESITFLGTKIAEFKGKKRIFYLYKVKYDYDTSLSYLGISGPFDPSSKTVTIKDPVAGVYEDEEFDTARESEFLRAFLKRRVIDMDDDSLD